MILGITLVAAAAVAGVFGTIMITDAIEDGKKATANPISTPPQKPLTATEKREQDRREFVENRRALQEAVMDAEGDLVTVDLQDVVEALIRIDNGDAQYAVPVGKSGGTEVWLYNTNHSVAELRYVGDATRHEVIDVAELPVVEKSASIPIGECVVVEAWDGSIVQLLLVDVHRRADGDQVDSASFRYEVYPPGTTQIRALRNGQ